VVDFINVITVCGAGVGSGVLIKMATEEALEKLGLKKDTDFSVTVAGTHEAKSMDFDICVTQSIFMKDLRTYAKENNKNWNLVEVQNLMSSDEIKTKIEPIVKTLMKK